MSLQMAMTQSVCRDCHHEEQCAPDEEIKKNDNETTKDWEDMITDTGGED